jgi:hypothetical protein
VNIFVLDKDPGIAARMLADKHVVKMALESAQILCTVSDRYGVQAQYRPTHRNHPAVRWAGDTVANWKWTVAHGLAICEEYTYRYGKTHKCQSVIEDCLHNGGKPTDGALTPHPLCMPDDVKVANDPVESYRKYYKVHKSDIVYWHKKPERGSWYV